MKKPTKMEFATITAIGLAFLMSGCGTYSSVGYTRVASVTVVDKPAKVSGTVVFSGVVDTAWRYGHIPWYYFWAIGNVAPTRYTYHVVLRPDTSPNRQPLPNDFRIMQTERPIAMRTPPAKGLFLLDDGDKVLVGLSNRTLDRRTRVIVYPLREEQIGSGKIK